MTTEPTTTAPTTTEPIAPSRTREPRTRRLWGAAALSLALVGGGAAGALLGPPTVSQAEGSTTVQSDDEQTGRPAPGHRFPHLGEGLTTAATALGIGEDDLRERLADGQSVAQVAEAEGVDLQEVIDALVANGTDRLEAAIDALPDRVAELVERKGLPGRPGHRADGGLRHRGALGDDGQTEADGA